MLPADWDVVFAQYDVAHGRVKAGELSWGNFAAMDCFKHVQWLESDAGRRTRAPRPPHPPTVHHFATAVITPAPPPRRTAPAPPPRIGVVAAHRRGAVALTPPARTPPPVPRHVIPLDPVASYAPPPCIRAALEVIATRPMKFIAALPADLTLLQQMPFALEHLKRLEDARARLAVGGGGTQIGKALYIGYVSTLMLLRVPLVLVLMGLNAKLALSSLHEKVFAEPKKHRDGAYESFFSRVGLQSASVGRRIWTDLDRSSREELYSDARNGKPRIVCALASDGNLMKIFGAVTPEMLSRVAVIIDESHDLFDLPRRADGTAGEEGEDAGDGDEDGGGAAPKQSTPTKVAAALTKWLFSRDAATGRLDGLRVDSLHVVTACSGDLSNVVCRINLPHLDSAPPVGPAWYSLSSPPELLRQRGYVSLQDLQPGIPVGSKLRAASLNAKNGYGLDRTGRLRAPTARAPAGKTDDEFIKEVTVDDVEPDLYAYISGYCKPKLAPRAMLLFRSGAETEKGANLFRTTHAMVRLWEGKLAAVVSCGKGFFWLKDDRSNCRYATLQQAIRAIHADPAYSSRLLVVHANNMEGSVTLACEGRVPLAMVFCGLTARGSNINAGVNQLGRLTGYGMGLRDPDSGRLLELPSVFAHETELAVCKPVSQFQERLFANAAATGDIGRGSFSAETEPLLKSGVRQGAGSNDVVGHVR
jgi:hypothetical protein